MNKSLFLTSLGQRSVDHTLRLSILFSLDTPISGNFFHLFTINTWRRNILYDTTCYRSFTNFLYRSIHKAFFSERSFLLTRGAARASWVGCYITKPLTALLTCPFCLISSLHCLLALHSKWIRLPRSIFLVTEVGSLFYFEVYSFILLFLSLYLKLHIREFKKSNSDFTTSNQIIPTINLYTFFFKKRITIPGAGNTWLRA